MNRRQVLKGIGAGGMASVAVGSAAARRPNTRVSDQDLDALKVVRDGEVVRTYDDPSVEDIGRIQSELGENDRLLDTDDCCIAECKSDCCPYRCCMYGGDC